MFKKIINNYKTKKAGKPLTIAWDYKSLEDKIAGFMKHTYTIITGNTGSGKTKFTKHLLLSSIRKFRINNPNRKVKVLWFALEETKEYFYLSILSNIISEKYNLQYSVPDLLSYFNTDLEPLLSLDLTEVEKDLEEIKSVFECIDSEYNPYGIYKKVREYMHTIGEDIVEQDEEGNRRIVGYKYNNDDDYVFVVLDHFTLLTAEKGKTNWENLSYFSREYALNQIVKRFGCVFLLVQQQVSETEKVELWQGETLVNKVKPTLNGLAEYKNSQQDATMAIGIFNPARYNIRNYNKIDILPDQSIRFIIVLKDRHFGTEGVEKGFKFNGATNEFKEYKNGNTRFN